MVPVRKPGRPLSTCPCPPGRPCVCGGVRVAIPKKQKCGCPTGTAKETEDAEKGPSPPETPTSPIRPSFRVTKSSCCSKPNNRKQSFDPTSLERMDPRSINVMAAPNGHGITHGLEIADSTVLQDSQTDLDGFGPNLGMLATGPGGTFASPQAHSYASPVPFNMGFQYAQPNRFPNGIKLEDGLYSTTNGGFPGSMSPSPFINGNQPTLAVRSLPQPTPLNLPLMNKTNGTTPGGSCCSSKTPAAPTRNNSGLAQQMYSQPYVPKPATGSSCCSSKAQTPSPTANTPTSQQMLEQAYMTPFPYPTVFTYPGDYGSWQQPIDPVIWQQVASQTTMPLNNPLAPTTTPTNGTDTTTSAAGTSHQCSCGAGCRCVGCLAHPFNAQMFQYVNNAYSGGNNGSNVGSPVNGDGSQPPPQQPQQQQHLPQHQQQTQPAANGHTHPHSGQDTPQEAPTPAASEGSPREEQALSTLDYFFVDLPISGLCGGSMETCPCGERCDCPGCLVHNVPPLRRG